LNFRTWKVFFESGEKKGAKRQPIICHVNS
jgi:hypothetical protein